MKVVRQVYESFVFAWQAISSNLMRTVLSLLGVTVGIFAIVAVFTIVDSLERNVRSSLKEIGDKVVYVQKWPWSFGGEYQWWRYMSWPEPKYSEFKYISDRIESAQGVAVLDVTNTQVRRGGNSGNAGIWGVSHDYNLVSEVDVESGRYFSPLESSNGRNVVIIGAKVAEWLFPNGGAPIGQQIQIKGQRYAVIGVLKAKGASMISFSGNPDEKCYIPYLSFSKHFTNAWSGVDIVAKGLDSDEKLENLEAEITGLMRTKRGLKPSQESNFSINRPDAAAAAIGGIFVVLSIAGWVIGSFSLLVGGFGIANIMFVSVKERTNLIGIQKSLGAKQYFILLQFLFEAILLSLVGGLFGVLLVYLITFIPMGTFEVVMLPQNVILGLTVSCVIGVLSGLIPALVAARLDPVEAIRAK